MAAKKKTLGKAAAPERPSEKPPAPEKLPAPEQLPRIAGVSDLRSLLVFIEIAAQRESWLKQACAIVERNEKILKLLSAPEVIERDLRNAATDRDKAAAALEKAQVEARSVAQAAEDAFAGREKALSDGEAKLKEDIARCSAELQEREDGFETTARKARAALEELETTLKAQAEEQAKAAESLERREKRIKNREDKAAAAKRAAEALQKRMTEAMQPAA